MIREILSFLAMGGLFVSNAETIIYPIPVQMEKNKATITIRDDNVKYEAKIYRWVQENGEDKLVEIDEKEAVVFPYLFTAKPSGTTLKIAILKDKTDTEMTYRIVLEELATQKNTENTETENIKSGVTVQKVYSIPVFVKGKSSEKIEYSVNCKDRTLLIQNTGTKHIKITAIDTKQMNEYVLPNSWKRFETDKISGIIRLSDGNFIKYECN